MEKTYLINTLFFKGGILMQNVMKKILNFGLEDALITYETNPDSLL